MKWRQLLPLAIVAAAVAPLSRAAVDACSYVSTREAGIRVNASRMRTGEVTGCSFADARGGNVVMVIRQLAASDAWTSAQTARMARGTYREVAGLGDRAFLYATHSVAVLCVFDGRYYVQVSLYRPPDGSEVATLQAIARRALAWLHSADEAD
jgi:hypothetical protein